MQVYAVVTQVSFVREGGPRDQASRQQINQRLNPTFVIVIHVNLHEMASLWHTGSCDMFYVSLQPFNECIFCIEFRTPRLDNVQARHAHLLEAW